VAALSVTWQAGKWILTAHKWTNGVTVEQGKDGGERKVTLESDEATVAMFRGLEAQATKIEDLEAQLRRAHIATHDLLVAGEEADQDRHKVRLIVKVPSAAQTTPDEWVDTTFLETFDVPIPGEVHDFLCLRNEAVVIGVEPLFERPGDEYDEQDDGP